MSGAIVLALVILVVIPIAMILQGLAVAALLGWALKADGEARHEGSELLELNT
ncbi:MAG: hypothetical protein Q8K58_13855 [Acidimicrobiales bacterium]|nr:hypothetical protein [Acidimicrobiales bacterium]